MTSTILKAGAPGKALKRLGTVDLADHLREAHGVIEDAHRHAAAHLAEARAQSKRDAEAARRAAHEEGFRKGLEEGAAAGRQEALAVATQRFNEEHANLTADLGRAVAQFDAMKEKLRLGAQRDLLDFAVMLARRLTFAIGTLHREAVIENVNRAIDCVGRSTNLTVRVNSADLVSLETFAAEMLRELAGAKTVQVVPDDTIAPGGCVVRSDHTEADARLETQADEIAALLLGEQPNG